MRIAALLMHALDRLETRAGDRDPDHHAIFSGKCVTYKYVLYHTRAAFCERKIRFLCRAFFLLTLMKPRSKHYCPEISFNLLHKTPKRSSISKLSEDKSDFFFFFFFFLDGFSTEKKETKKGRS